MGNLNEAFERIGEIRNFDEWEVGVTNTSISVKCFF